MTPRVICYTSFQIIFSFLQISGKSKMDPDILTVEEQFDLSDPLNIQENEKNVHENNEEIDPMLDSIVQLKNYKHSLDYSDTDEKLYLWQNLRYTY